jgi:2-haloacid dehalogenase
MNNFDNISNLKILTFDIFGTLLNLKDSLIPYLENNLQKSNENTNFEIVWDTWRDRQRIEQYQDNILMLGHSGYLKTCERALLYTLDKHKIIYNNEQIENIMSGWYFLKPFDDVIENLPLLQKKFKLVILSNGEQNFLEHLAKNQLKFEFDHIISVELAGQFKPSPAVYRKASQILNENPLNISMVASHSFDVIGAKACGFKSSYIDRYDLPLEHLNYKIDIHVENFIQFTDFILYGKIPNITNNNKKINIE